MKEYDKIRILWIHDEVRGLPGTNFPNYLSEYFECVIKYPDGKGDLKIAPIGSVKEFNDIFKKFIEDKDYSKLPVEILATDYDLSKYESSQIQSKYGNELDLNKKAIDKLIDNDEEGVYEKDPNSINRIDYDGFLIAGFYLAATRSHPCALVKMTTKQDDLVGTSLSHFESTFTTMFDQKLDFNKARSWEKIVHYGAKVLREQIKILFEKRLLKLDFDNLIDLFNNNSKIITIFSQFVTRKIPIAGLFIDIPSEIRDKSVKEWVSEIISNQHIYTIEDIYEAKSNALKLIKNYLNCDEELLRKRLNLSALNKVDNPSDDEKKILQELQDFFQVKFNKKGNGNCNKFFDIRSFNCSKSVKRWTVIFVITEMISLWVKTNSKLGSLTDEKLKEIAPLSKEDIYLALFLIPRNPIILPWHNYSDRNRYATWDRFFSSVDLKLNDILSGNICTDNGKEKGLKRNELFILEICYIEEWANWLKFPLIKKIIKGNNV